MVNNDLERELRAMQDIALSLQRLDAPTRARVLHWLEERFSGDTSFPAAAPAPFTAAVTELRIVPPQPAGVDEGLSMPTATDLFSPRSAAPPGAAPQPVTALLHEFVAEFQELAREWDGVTHALPAAS